MQGGCGGEGELNWRGACLAQASVSVTLPWKPIPAPERRGTGWPERSTSDTLTISKKEQQSPSKSGRESKMLEWSEDTWANMMLEDTKEDRREPQESIEQLLQKAQVSFDSMNALLRDVQKLGIKMASSSTKSSSAASLIKVGLGLVKDLRTHSDRLQEALVTERELQQPGQLKDPP